MRFWVMYILLCYMLTSHAQQSYNPFSVGTATPIPTAPQPMSLQNYNKQQQQQILQQNQQTMSKFGYTTPPTQADIKTAQQNMLHGQAPAPTRQEQLNKQVEDLLIEADKDLEKLKNTNYYASDAYTKDLPNYIIAKDKIINMLDGKTPLSIKDAYYYMELAYGNVPLGYTEYNNIIRNNAKFIKQWLTQNKYDTTNAEALHYGIQKFMADTLFIINNGIRQGHLPYYYDYVDAVAQNKQNYFVTKTMATGSGQCHTLPILYLILAESLQVEALIAYNPRHSFIQFRNGSGTLVNYETTVDKYLPDQFYMETLPVMAYTMKNNIHVTSFDKKQAVATALYELGVCYIQEHGIGDGTFVQSCLQIAAPLFPAQDYICLAQYNIQKSILAKKFNDLARSKQITSTAQISKYPDLSKAFNDFYSYMERTQALGVQDFPEQEYLDLLTYYDTKSKIQISKNVKAKTKKSLFF